MSREDWKLLLYAFMFSIGVALLGVMFYYAWFTSGVEHEVLTTPILLWEVR
jgi:hypothetical protein